MRKILAQSQWLREHQQAAAAYSLLKPALNAQPDDADLASELAMVTGDGRSAVVHAQRGAELAEAALPQLRRHRVKSEVVLAAAFCSAGDLDSARKTGAGALAAAADYGLIPLHWAVACLLADIGDPARSPEQATAARDPAEARDRSAAFVTRHGGRWKPR